MTRADNVFTIGAQAVRKKNTNILWGAILSLLLVVVIVSGHYRYPETYNDVLVWSVVAFVIGANLVNYLRYRRYLRLIADHNVEVFPGKVRFRSGKRESELSIEDITVVNLFRRKGVLRHVQIRLGTNRGIRLEGYGDLERLAALITEQVPKAQVVDRHL